MTDDHICMGSGNCAHTLMPNEGKVKQNYYQVGGCGSLVVGVLLPSQGAVLDKTMGSRRDNYSSYTIQGTTDSANGQGLNACAPAGVVQTFPIVITEVVKNSPNADMPTVLHHCYQLNTVLLGTTCGAGSLPAWARVSLIVGTSGLLAPALIPAPSCTTTYHYDYVMALYTDKAAPQCQGQ